MSERTVDAGRAIAHGIYAPINRWTESDALDPMFEKPQKAQVVRIKIEAVSLGSTSMAPSLDAGSWAGAGQANQGHLQIEHVSAIVRPISQA